MFGAKGFRAREATANYKRRTRRLVTDEVRAIRFANLHGNAEPKAPAAPVVEPVEPTAPAAEVTDETNVEQVAEDAETSTAETAADQSDQDQTEGDEADGTGDETAPKEGEAKTASAKPKGPKKKK
ncbi:hypothetical protein [Bradyrhizobium sp. th.b2]|uniref:hypothetical protein n=1 Tax=Bradyrhizobium sp. th-b2 TaxID=172088 RepID=UPI000402F58B|nr:hypothetical protein [Bradyrhizobium sp. th.b2]